jgi:hypothetical protein
MLIVLPAGSGRPQSYYYTRAYLSSVLGHVVVDNQSTIMTTLILRLVVIDGAESIRIDDVQWTIPQSTNAGTRRPQCCTMHYNWQRRPRMHQRWICSEFESVLAKIQSDQYQVTKGRDWVSCFEDPSYKLRGRTWFICSQKIEWSWRRGVGKLWDCLANGYLCLYTEIIEYLH